MQLIIPVAGIGSRLRPHTLTTAKPLMHVAGKTVLEHIIDRFKGLPITELILITGHLKHQFDDFKAPWPVKTVEQKVMRGTAHAISLTKPLITGPVIIAYSDTVFDADLSVIERLDPDGVLWAKEVEDYQRFGVIIHHNHIMTRIVEKPDEPISKLANIGLYYIKDHQALFTAIEAVLASPPGKGGEFFLADALQLLVDSGKKLRVEPVDGWYDTGTWESTIETNRELLKQQSKHRDFPQAVIIEPVWIEDGVVIERSVVGPYVSVGKNAVIRNSFVTDSIINAHARIENAHLDCSIIGDHAVVTREKKRISLGQHSMSPA
jgi:glucose-1-phosphate thymidylyltransferase